MFICMNDVFVIAPHHTIICEASPSTFPQHVETSTTTLALHDEIAFGALKMPPLLHLQPN